MEELINKNESINPEILISLRCALHFALSSLSNFPKIPGKCPTFACKQTVSNFFTNELFVHTTVNIGNLSVNDDAANQLASCALSIQKLTNLCNSNLAGL